MTDAELVNKIEQVRAVNKARWDAINAIALESSTTDAISALYDVRRDSHRMDVLRIALAYRPAETKAALAEIRDGDIEVVRLTGLLVGETT